MVISGIGCGSVRVKGLMIAGLATGGKELTGIFLAGGTVRLVKEGQLTGLSLSSFNYLQGNLRGVSLGLVNYAWKVERGFQLGIINIIRQNRPGLRILPVFNTSW